MQIARAYLVTVAASAQATKAKAIKATVLRAIRGRAETCTRRVEAQRLQDGSAEGDNSRRCKPSMLQGL